MIEVIFWFSLFVVAYVWVGYPLVLALWRRLHRRPVRKMPYTPSVSLIVAARNEEDTIEAKIRNCLKLDYPRSRLQIIVALDAPSDGTREIAARYAGQIDIVQLGRPSGKTAALNRAAAIAGGEVLVFSDARQRIDPHAVRELAANFADPEVGAVSGELILEEDDDVSGGVGLYWRYEKIVRKMESDIHSLPGATGALYAIRSKLYGDLPEGMILDDVAIPMRAVLAGRRAVFDSAARAYDRVFPPEVEYRRKVRTLSGNYEILFLMPELLVPWRNPIFFQYVSHKLGRLVVPLCLITLLASNLFLRSGIYAWLLAGQISWYVLVMAGLWREKRAADSVQPVPAADGLAVLDEREAA